MAVMAADACPWNDSNVPKNVIDGGFEDNFKPHDKLPDSASYISSLETKLGKLQGKGKESKSSEFVHSLEATRGQHMRDLILQNERLESYEIIDEAGSRTINVPVALRRLCPERQALSAEELQRLLLADELAKITAQLQAAETNNDSTQPNM